MFQTLEDCADAWKAAGQHGSREERIARNLLWTRYYAGLTCKQSGENATISPRAAETVDRLFREGLLTPESTVLDIGSGTGDFTLAFAARCAHVTALDMDAVSLAVLAADAAQLSFGNIVCETTMWESYTPKHTFSFVFSSMCPAVCDYDELTKMESLSTHGCGLVAVTRGSYDLHRKKLMQLLNVHPTGGMTTEALWYYEALYCAGRHPSIASSSFHAAYETPLEDVCQRSALYFAIFGIPAKTSLAVIRPYFESIAKNGMVADETQLNTALIHWLVSK